MVTAAILCQLLNRLFSYIHSCCVFSLPTKNNNNKKFQKIDICEFVGFFNRLPAENTNISILITCVWFLSLFDSWDDGCADKWGIMPMGMELGWAAAEGSQRHGWTWEPGRMTAHLPSGRWPRRCRYASTEVSSNCSWGQHPRDGASAGFLMALLLPLLSVVVISPPN